MKNAISPNLIAPCGMTCGISRAYLCENNPCHGCRQAQENKPKTRINCPLRVCIRRTGKFCCYCSELPCERLKHLDKRYRTKYGVSEIENLEFIRKHGIRRFVEMERKRLYSIQRNLPLRVGDFFHPRNPIPQAI